MILEVNRADLTAPRQEAMINIYTDDPHYRHLEVPITLRQAQRVQVNATPDRIEAVGAGAHLVRVRAVGDKAVRIESADADHAAIKCTWAAGPGNDATLKISVNAAALTTANATVRVRLTEPAATIVTIPVSLRKE